MIVVDVKRDVHDTAASCRERGTQATALQLDVTDADAPQRMCRPLSMRMGRLDVAFNNVGIAGVNVDVADFPDEIWDQVMNVNLRSIFRAMKQQIRVMRTQGGGGAIVNTASVASVVALKLSSGYIASKHALMGLTKAAALDAIADGIRINAVCPGIIDTPLLEHGKQIPGLIEALQASVPRGRLGTAEEIARCVLFLASDDASYMVGHGMLVDGGVTIV